MVNMNVKMDEFRHQFVILTFKRCSTVALLGFKISQNGFHIEIFVPIFKSLTSVLQYVLHHSIFVEGFI